MQIRKQMGKQQSEIQQQYPGWQIQQTIRPESGHVSFVSAFSPVVVTITQKGYVKRVADEVYQLQGRGGRGKKGVTAREEDQVQHILSANTMDSLLVFTNRGRVYQINYLRCIFCGLCIEACPTRALTMTNEYELAGTSRAEMIFEKDQLLAPLREGMLNTPHPMVPGTSDTDYYREQVTGPSSEQVDWVGEHRPQDESLAGARRAAEQKSKGSAR